MAFVWIIEGALARGSRPKQGKSWRSNVPQSVVDCWVRQAMTKYGIRSAICLLDERSLKFYDQLRVGLVSYLRLRGLHVEHVPVRLQPKMFSRAQLKAVWQAFLRLPKPTLVFCSAGRMRTHKAISHIKRKLRTTAKYRDN